MRRAGHRGSSDSCSGLYPRRGARAVPVARHRNIGKVTGAGTPSRLMPWFVLSAPRPSGPEHRALADHRDANLSGHDLYGLRRNAMVSSAVKEESHAKLPESA